MEANRPASDATAFAIGASRLPLIPHPITDLDNAFLEPTRPGQDSLSLLPPGIAQDEERGPHFQACKTAFFFKLQRELEKVCPNSSPFDVRTKFNVMQINAFYLEKEAELKMRLETLLMKRRAAATRVLPDSLEDNATKDHVEWSAVEEGFHLLERDLGKLQVRPTRDPVCTRLMNFSAIRRD